ncbi:MAG TPA: C40 family peptidase, partial [Mycobacterium sp.]|nr:C40 family peptidase [Mycobacterium sp.]
QREHRSARDATGRIQQEAHADAASPGLSPLARREAARRQAGRLRASHRVVSGTHRSAARRAAQLRLLRYAAARRRARGLPPASGRAATAVRAALSRLGRPYVWGATGPDRFDCSGLVQWAYHQAGVDLQRTTYDQIHQGIAVPRSQVQPGDLVFPHAGHVQMAIGDGLVVEAPYSGANVRISHLGANIAIRRPC